MGTKLNFNPTRDWVVFRSPRQETTDSGIHLLGDAQKNISTNIVEILEAGPDCVMVKQGDTVLVHPESGALIIHLDKKEYACVNEFQIVGVIPKNA
jgi:co-chaperonin GroES (HSP10)